MAAGRIKCDFPMSNDYSTVTVTKKREDRRYVPKSTQRHPSVLGSDSQRVIHVTLDVEQLFQSVGGGRRTRHWESVESRELDPPWEARLGESRTGDALEVRRRPRDWRRVASPAPYRPQRRHHRCRWVRQLASQHFALLSALAIVLGGA